MARLTLTFFSLHHACLTVLYVAIAAFLPDTRLGHLARESQQAQVAFAVLCVLCLLAFVDALSNALAEHGYGWPRKGLHGWTWRAMVLGQAWLGYVGLRGGIGYLAASLFFLSAFFAAAIAYLDLRERQEKRLREVDRWSGLDA